MLYRGKNHKVFEIEAFGRKHSVIITEEHYSVDDSLALRVLELSDDPYEAYEGFAPYGLLTVNLGPFPLPDPFCQFVKNWSENEPWAEHLARQIGEPTVIAVRTGFVIAPLYRFDLSKLYE